MSRSVRLLIVDDEQHVRSSLAAWFRDEGYSVFTADDGTSALSLLEREGAEVIVADIKMPGMDGLDLQRRVRDITPDATMIIMTAHATVETAVEALKQGAYDYVTKPFNPEYLSRVVANAAERYVLIRENRELRTRLRAGQSHVVFDDSSPMKEILAQVEQIAPTDTSVLINGESGTGKEVIARLIHERSSRQPHPCIAVNCGALAEGVLESELFGHERGAFTGAISQRLGKIELADRGTLFLDEIGDIPPKVQVDLLRVLQERALMRVGGHKPVSVDFRLVTATHRDLRAEIQAERFRPDLYFRINVITLTLPPLRDRPMDIPLFADHFRERYAGQMNRRIVGFSSDAIAALCTYSWPGNVRELQNAIERAVVLCRGSTIGTEHLPLAQNSVSSAEGGGAFVPVSDLKLSTLEYQHIRRVLALSHYNVTQAARHLGIDRVTLYNKMKKFNIDRP